MYLYIYIFLGISAEYQDGFQEIHKTNKKQLPLWIQTLSEKVLNPLNHTPSTS